MIPPRTTDQLTPSLPLARQVLAGTTYDSDALHSQIAETGAVAVIPPRPNRLQPPHLDLLAYRNRNQVERLINRLKQFRHTTHYDKARWFLRRFRPATRHHPLAKLRTHLGVSG